MTSRLWHICCPGPSFSWDWYSEEGHGQDGIACVNLALVDAPRCRYWCCIDRPNPGHEEALEHARRVKPLLLTQEKQYKFWEKKELGIQMANVHAVSRTWVLTAKGGAGNYSTFWLTFWLIEREKATRIQFHGCDLKGVGYFGGRNPRNYAPKTFNVRWSDEPNKELMVMRRLYKGACENGVELLGLPEHVTSWQG